MEKDMFDALEKWMKDLCWPNKLEKFIKRGKVEGDSSPEEYNECRRYDLYTGSHQYHIVAHVHSNKKNYLGCTASNRKPWTGEDHLRGRDLPDGSFTRETWNKILGAIVRMELDPLHIVPCPVNEEQPVAAESS